MKKKIYSTPQTKTVHLRGPVVMLNGSNTVNEFDDGGGYIIGDED